VHGAVPDGFWNSGANIASSEVAVHVVNHIFKKLNTICLVEDGQVAASLNCVKSVTMFLFIMFTNLAF
jgi:hypothetical protein